MAESSRITIVGAGVVGTNLARRLIAAGHEVSFAARDVGSEKVTAALAALPDATARPLAGAADDADLLILAVPYAALEDTVRALGDVGTTPLVDATNTVGTDLPEGCATILDVIAAVNPNAQLVKAFNTIGAEAFADPILDGRPAFLPVSGDEPGTTAVVELAQSMGFDAISIGGREAAVHNESFAKLWIHLAFAIGLGRDFGFARINR